MRIRNLTPHAVTVYDGVDHPLVTYYPVGLARAEHSSTKVSEIDTDAGIPIPVRHCTYGAVEGLPMDCAPDELFIVSAITAQAAKVQGHPLANRLLVTSDPVRDSDGHIKGCRAFATLYDSCPDDESVFVRDEYGNIEW